MERRAKTRYLILIFALSAAGLLGVLSLSHRTASAAAKYNGLIAFVSNRNGPPGEIYVMNPDGTNQRNITNSPASECHPAFSPEGKKIAFVRDFNSIFVMNPDGSGETRVVDSASGLSSITGFPDWSPDGTKIVFNAIASGSRDGSDVYVVNIDGSGLARLTTNPAEDTSPVWSPDGTKIAFATNRDVVPNEINYEIYSMNADGSNQTRLTNNTKFDFGPAWSPDGTRIALTSRRDDNFEVYVMNADGSNQIRLTNNGEQDSDPKWSPDGTKIAFLSSRDGRFGEIYTMNPDGTGLVNLTNSDYVFEMDPSWQSLSQPFVPSSTPTPTPTPTPTSWVPFNPSATQTALEVVSCGGKTWIKAKITFNDAGFRVADWDQVARTGNSFAADIKAERYTELSAQVITFAEHVYELGELAPGNYSFSLMSRGTFVKSIQFTVANSSAVSSDNPVDDASVFVWRHYEDFLGRGPDDQGFGFWTTNLTSGCGTDLACVERHRIDTSAAFFLSIEFQRTGFVVYRLYRASYGRMPTREEFLPASRAIARGLVVNAPGWQTLLENNTQTFIQDWVAGPDFQFNYSQLSDPQFVDKLAANAGIDLGSNRDALIDGLAAGTQTRAGAVRTIIDNSDFNQKEFNRAFVLMQYFGYLQRNPNEGQNTDWSGYNFWLTKLNQFGGDYVKADMVKAFIDSGEYRTRFCSQ
jgi:Tol biopolymer transport system component